MDTKRPEEHSPAQSSSSGPGTGLPPGNEQSVEQIDTLSPQAIEALVHSENRYRQLFTLMKSAFAVHEIIRDENGTPCDYRFLEVNPAFERQTGLRAEKLVGRTLLEVIPDTERFWIERYGQVVDTGESVQFENFSRTLNRWYNVIAYRSEPEHFAVVFTDVTKQKQANKNIQAEKERAQMYLDIAGVMLIALDLEGKVELINRRGCEILGREQEEIIGQEWFANFLPPESRDQVREIFEKITRGQIEQVEYAENLVLCADGSTRTIAWHNAIIRDSNGEISGTLGSGEDITEQRRSIEALREASLRQEEAVKAGKVGLWDWNLKTNQVQYSREWKSQIGYVDYEIGESFEEWKTRVHPDGLEPILVEIQECIADEQKVFNAEFRFRHKDGSYRWVLAQASVLRDESGHAIRMVGSHVDITERKHAEEKLSAFERLRTEAEKLAATGRMAARVAHEINNPLAGIKNSFHLIKNIVPDDHPDYDMVAIIDRELDRIALIVKQMYQLHSPQADNIRNISVDQAIGDVVAMLKPLCRQYRVAIETKDMPTDVVLCLPEGGLHQILYNLLSNAVEASSPGGVVDISAELDHGKEDVLIECHDRGCGISVEQRDLIFEPFFTTRDTVASEMGMGLGLSIIKSLTEALRGTIDFESIPNKGTIFRVTLPLNTVK